MALATGDMFDAVIMDVHLPGVDGVEATRRIRAAGNERRVPIIALTADVFFDGSEKLARTDMDACLLKPLDENRLWQLLHRLCATVGPEPGAGHGPPEPGGAVRQTEAGATPALPDKGLVTKLIAELPRHKHRIGEALANRDGRALRKELHELKGVAGYFDLTDLYASIEEFEQRVAGDDCDPTRVGASLAQLNRRIDDLIGELAMRG